VRSTVAGALAGEPDRVPSEGVTSTVTVSPASPWPGTDRSKVSVVEEVPEVVFWTVPFTFHT
jgi:hypothetical protein